MKRIVVVGTLAAFIVAGASRPANAGSGHHSHAGAIIGGVVAGVVLGHTLSHIGHDHHYGGRYYGYPPYPYSRPGYPRHHYRHDGHRHHRHCGHYGHRGYADYDRGGYAGYGPPRHVGHGRPGYGPRGHGGHAYGGSYGRMVPVGPVR